MHSRKLYLQLITQSIPLLKKLSQSYAIRLSAEILSEFGTLQKELTADPWRKILERHLANGDVDTGVGSTLAALGKIWSARTSLENIVSSEKSHDYQASVAEIIEELQEDSSIDTGWNLELSLSLIHGALAIAAYHLPLFYLRDYVHVNTNPFGMIEDFPWRSVVAMNTANPGVSKVEYLFDVVRLEQVLHDLKGLSDE